MGNTVVFSTSKGRRWSGCPRDTSKIQCVCLLWKKKEHILENTALDKGQPSVHILAFPAFPAVIRTRWKTSKQVSSPCLWVPQGELQA